MLSAKVLCGARAAGFSTRKPASDRFCWSCLILVLAGIVAGCTAPDESRRPSEATTSRRQALSTFNTMSTNALLDNGYIFNGYIFNGYIFNGYIFNGYIFNGYIFNGILGETLRSNENTRQFLQYVYACAMPEGAATTLDPNDGQLACNTDGSCGESGNAAGYTCSADKCVVPLSGALGLGVNADGSTWWESDTCDESCQRWVSACLLARTNAYGTRVSISLRAPADAPQKIKDALAATPEELAEYPLREGAYYGNIFATTPGTLDESGQFVPSAGGAAGDVVMATPSFNACAGPGSNIPELTKRFCSSQGDQVVINVPGVCVGTGTQAGACDGVDATGSIYGCLTSTDPFEPRTHHDEVLTVYLKKPIAWCGNAVCEDREVPIGSGLSVSAGEDATSCPSDCHPGTWARDFSPNLGSGVVDKSVATSFNTDFVGARMSAVLADDTIVVTGNASAIDLGSEKFLLSEGNAILAKYQADGTLLWWRRIQPSEPASAPPDGIYFTNGVSVARAGHDGHITVVGYAVVDRIPSIIDSNGQKVPVNSIWINTYDASGALLNHSIPIYGGSPPKGQPVDGTQVLLTRAFAVDSQGDLVLSGTYRGPTMFEMVDTIQTLEPLDNTLYRTDGAAFLAKVSSQGKVLWTRRWEPAPPEPGSIRPVNYTPPRPLSLAIDADENIVLLTSDGVLRKLCSDGSNAPGESCRIGVPPRFSQTWTKDIGGVEASTTYTVAAVDANRNVYAGGYFSPGYTLCNGVTPSVKGRPPFIEKYGPDGSCLGANFATTVCPPDAPDCLPPLQGLRGVHGVSIGFESGGNVLLGLFGNPAIGGGIDFGVGTFPTYNSNSIFLAAYSSDLRQVRWAKKIPTILSGSLLGMSFDSQGHVVTSGNYSGSMLVDDRLLVTAAPEDPRIIDSFLGSFDAPSASDTTSPLIGAVADATGSPISNMSTVPGDIFLQATSSAGAVVFFMPPTALDSGHAGTSVACSPPPNTKFPIGTTPVTCTASDPLGNRTSKSFMVRVTDLLGPVMTRVPAAISAEATAPAGATVTYELPTATDQVDGIRPVTCSPASGGRFAPGVTTVTCTSSDTRGSRASATFSVNVTVVDTTPPRLTLPGTITEAARSINGAVVSYSVSATDAVDGPINPACTPASGSTFALGTTPVICKAADAHGNQATGSFQVQVQYRWSGFLQPINADGSSVFKLGSTIPVKFRLSGASAGIRNAVAKLSLARISSRITGKVVETVPACAANSSNAFRYDRTSGQYVFNLGTRNLSKGTWRLSLDLGDGVSRMVTISLR
jgi:hypothetical protein